MCTFLCVLDSKYKSSPGFLPESRAQHFQNAQDRATMNNRMIIIIHTCTPLIPTSARRAMAEQVVCRATTEHLPSGHRANSLGSRSASDHRAATERLPSKFARWPLGRRSVVARQTTCSAIARRALSGISGVLVIITETFQLTMCSALVLICYSL